MQERKSRVGKKEDPVRAGPRPSQSGDATPQPYNPLICAIKSPVNGTTSTFLVLLGSKSNPTLRWTASCACVACTWSRYQIRRTVRIATQAAPHPLWAALRVFQRVEDGVG
jgi:hypothetical protein